MIGLPSAVDFGWDSLRLNDLPVAWMAANHRKPQRNSDVTSLVIHADAAWSQAHQDADGDWVQAQLLGVAALIWLRKYWTRRIKLCTAGSMPRLRQARKHRAYMTQTCGSLLAGIGARVAALQGLSQRRCGGTVYIGGVDVKTALRAAK